MKFNASPRHTVGIEWELQLLDPITLDLLDGIVPLMEFFPDSEFVKPEYMQSCVELTSCVADNSAQATEDIRTTLKCLLQRCTELEMSVCGAGTHAFCRRLALITPTPRYQKIERQAGYSGHTQITFGTHVHVGMRSGDQAVRAMSLLTPALPVFIALSANSPFWRGHQTGHVAYRHQILSAAHNYGLPPRFADWMAFDRFLEAAFRSQTIRDFKDIHWDLRPHPEFGTLELRVMDAASDTHTLHGLTSLSRVAMVRAAEDKHESIGKIIPQDLPLWIERENRSRAVMHGLDASYIVDSAGKQQPLRCIAERLFEYCEPAAPDLDETSGMEVAGTLLSSVPACQRQIETFRKNNSARSVVAWLEETLLDDL